MRSPTRRSSTVFKRVIRPSARLRSVMSRSTMLEHCCWFRSRNVDKESSHSNTLPSPRTMRSSPLALPLHARSSSRAGRRGSDASTRPTCPRSNISCSLMPNRAQAAGLASSTWPSGPSCKMPSRLVSTIWRKCSALLRSASSAVLRSVMSRMLPINWRRPCRDSSETPSSIGKTLPSLRRPSNSRPVPMIFACPVSR